MANWKEIKNRSLDTINAAQTIVDKLPDLENSALKMSFSSSTDPFEFILALLKTLGGYDYVLHLISSFIATALPGVELAVKSVLITNITNLINCDLNPFITHQQITEGFQFDLRHLDILHILDYSPLDTSSITETLETEQKLSFQQKTQNFLKKLKSANHNPGKYFYFGCGNATTPDDLENAGDFNAFLWFVKNRATYRCVWNGVNIAQALIADSSFKKNSGKEKYNYYTQNPLVNPLKVDNKYQKGSGICTLEYHQTTGFPSNKLTVYIGNATTAETEDVSDIKEEIKDTTTSKKEAQKQLRKYVEQMIDLDAQEQILTEEFEHDKQSSSDEIISEEEKRAEYEEQIAKITDAQKHVQTVIDDKKEHIKEFEKTIIKDLNDLASVKYANIIASQNYYYNRTWIRFNFDFVMSMKLFDAKVVTAQLLDALTGCMSIDLNLSFEQLFIQNEIQKMVKAIVESDDTEVNDCFFAFSNEEYDNLLNRSELIRSGLFSINGETNTNIKINAQDILDSINTLNESSSKEEIQSTIEGSLREISATLSSYEDGMVNQFNGGVRVNFIENLLSKLSSVLVSAVLSPKLYLLLMMNFRHLQMDPLTDMAEVMRRFKTLFTSIIRKVRDELIRYLNDAIQKLVKELASMVTQRFIIEQGEYYERLIRQLINCFQLRRGNDQDFDIDNVDYADIYEQLDNAAPQEEC